MTVTAFLLGTVHRARQADFACYIARAGLDGRFRSP